MFALVALPLSCAGCRAAHRTMDFDTLILNARVVDGSGSPWYRADVGLRSGSIAAIGRLEGASAVRTVDAADRVLAPGFVDLMGQGTIGYINEPGSASSRLFQGITTHASGEGWSYAPQTRRTQPEPEVIGGESVRWRRFSEFFDIIERHGMPLNTAYNVGAAQVREVVMGEEDRAPTPAELERMQALVEAAMQDGATGLSSALIYPPGAYADDEELVALATVVARYGGVYSSHMRNESAHLLDAIEQTIAVGERAGLPVHIYHLKAAGRENWPLMTDAVERIEAARERGVEVTADIYPYQRVGLGLEALVPPEYFAAGADALRRRLDEAVVRKEIRMEIEQGGARWENWFRHTGQDWNKVLIVDAGNWPDRSIEGQSLSEAAAVRGADVWDLFFELVQAGDVVVTPEVLDESQKAIAVRRPWVMFVTDMSPVDPDTAVSAHPRAFGSFPRVLAQYVREARLIRLEDAIRRMSSMPMRLLGIPDRGLIVEGMAADLVLFDPEGIQDRATYQEPLRLAEGIDYVWVNGVLVIDDGWLTAARPGRVLRRPVRRVVQ